MANPGSSSSNSMVRTAEPRGCAGRTTSMASASKRMSRRPPVRVSSCAVLGVICRVSRPDCPRGRYLRRHAGYAYPAEQEQPRTAAELDPLLVDGCERPADEVERDEPASADPARRSIQRHEPSVDRGQRLAGGEDDRPARAVDGERALSRILSDVELEQRGEVVETDHLVASDHERVDPPAAPPPRSA